MVRLTPLQQSQPAPGVKKDVSWLKTGGQASPAGQGQAALGQVVDPYEKVQKRIRWLNSNMPLQQQLAADQVSEVLVQVGTSVAMEILKNLEGQAAQVRNPTTWVESAAKRALAGEAPKKSFAAPAAANAWTPQRGVVNTPWQVNSGAAVQATDQKLRKRIGWLNANASLQQQLTYDKVAPVLSTIGSEAAMTILKQLEENASSVRDPNAYVTAAGKRVPPAMDFGAPAAGYGGNMGFGAMPAAGDAVSDEKLRKRIGWLNNNLGLESQQQLRHDKVGPALQALGSHQAMTILKNFEESASTVRDPTAYVLSAAQRAAQNTAPMGGFNMGGGFGIGGGMNSLAVDKLKKRVGWMNHNLTLASPLQYDEVSKYLLGMDAKVVMDLLKNLEENAAEVKDPNAYIIAAARRGGGSAAKTGVVNKSPEEKLRTRIAWMNANVALASPLVYEQLAPVMLTLDKTKAMELLKMLEENAASVADPTAYLSQATQAALSAGGGGA